MKRALLCSAVLVAISCGVGCGSSAGQASRSELSTGARLTFPAAPADPVIEWIASYRSRADVDPKARKVARVLVGTQEEHLELNSPTAVAIGPDMTLYVVDQLLKAVVILNHEQKRFEVFRGQGGSSLVDPVGIALAGDGRLFVSDGAARKVFVFDAALRAQRVFGGGDLWSRPTALAVTQDGSRIAVCDTEAHRLAVLDTADGSLLFELGHREHGSREGEFNFPVAVAFDEQGYLYVSDYLNFRIQVFDSHGDLDTVFGQAGDRPGDLNRPRGIAVDSTQGVIFEVDGAFEVVQMFNLDGELLMWFGEPGRGPAQFSLPTGIARRGDFVAVADTMNHRVQLFRFLGRPL